MGSVPLAWYLGVLTMRSSSRSRSSRASRSRSRTSPRSRALPRLVRREQISAAQALNTSSLGRGRAGRPGRRRRWSSALGRSTAEGAAIAFLVDAATYLVDVAARDDPAAVPDRARRRRPAPARRDRRGPALPVGRPADPAARDREHASTGVCVGGVVVLAVVVLGRDVLRADPAALGFVVGAAGAAACSARR